MTKKEQLVIKKYPNRRLYNTQTSSYITLEELNELLRNDVDFVVVDAKTSEDLTRVTLTQIILEQEQKGYELLPLEMLKQMIKLYNNPLSSQYCEFMMAAVKMFNDSFNNTSDALKMLAMSDENPFYKHYQSMAKQNQEWLKKFMSK